tara:strand:+ start:343 stop:534 length:192 start_codon:yes stop_codon:yes gene_type:complete
MNQKELLQDLLKKREDLQKEIIEIQNEYNNKKDQYLRLQGSIDVIDLLVREEKAGKPLDDDIT